MKKWMTALLIAIIALPVFGTSVFAEEVVFEDGVYENVPLTVKYGEEIYEQFSETATVTIQEGNQHIEFGHTQTNFILDVTIPDGEVKKIDDEENKTRELGFNYNGDLNQPIQFDIHMFYGATHNMSAYLDVSDIPTVKIETPEEPEQPEEPTEPEVPVEEDEESTEPETSDSYAISFKASNMDLTPYYKEKAILLKQDGKTYLQFYGKEKQFEYVNELLFNGQAMLLKEIGTNGAYIAQIEIDESVLSDEITFVMDLTVPFGDMKHTALVDFDETTKEVVDTNDYELLTDSEIVNPDDEEVEVPEGNDNDNESTEPETSDSYAISFKASNMDLTPYYKEKAILLKQDGKTYLQFYGKEKQFEYVNELLFNGQAMLLKEIGTNGAYIAQIEIDESVLSDEVTFVMDLTVPFGNMKHTALVDFDETTKEVVDANDYELLTVIEETEDDNNEPTENNGNTGNNEGSTEDNNNNVSNDDGDKDNALVPDEAYKIKIKVYHADEDRPSAASGFFAEDAFLFVKNGERYIQMTVTGKQYIDSLKSKFGEMIIVSETEDSIVYQFKIDGELSDVVWLDMIITVPGIYDQEAHKARLFIDQDSLVQVDESKYLLAAGDNLNGIITNPEISDPGIVKPELNEPETDETAPPASNNGNPTNNPQTGENTNLLMYVLLLVGSAVPLAIQARKRFVA